MADSSSSDRTGADARADAESSLDAAPPTSAKPVASAPRKSLARRHWGKLTLATLIGVPVGGLAVWTAVAMNYTYSSGERAGYVQKMSRKGWVCKTWEGTLYTDIAKGFRSDSFNFTVRSDSIAHLVDSLSGKRVAVRYDQHVGLPTSCLGDTEYFVSGVRAIPE